MREPRSLTDFRRQNRRESCYDVQQVCVNGHQITSMAKSAPELTSPHCDQCGAVTITKCPKCDKDIKGYYHSNIVSGGRTAIPPYCKECGAAFPWKDKVSSKLPSDAPPLRRLEKLLDRFHVVARTLQSRHDSRPTLELNDEYDVQDLLHALLRIEFKDIRLEEWTPSYAGGCARVDFLLKQEQVLIEVKKTRASLKGKELGEQLLVDIAKYEHHPDCKHLVCFVYDPEARLGNPIGIQNDLEKKSSKALPIKVMIRPISD